MMDGEPQRAADLAYLALRDAILTGELAPNVRLTETALAESLALSRTPVRDAIRRLIMEGFLSRVRGEGLRVIGLQPDEVEQIFQIRLMLEPFAARRAARFATDAQIAELRDLAEEMYAITPPSDAEESKRLPERNSRFHNLIMEAAKSPRLSTMLAATVNVGLVLRTFRMYGERDMVRSARHHLEIADAIEARAPEWAASVMASHLHAAAAVAMRGDD
ncbi:GntR family transcriptional regulator [Acuticoccus sp. MNP-M23]|uniref:GntR family transcriptional regulator n=1 Tax=Acuticoccus sp. MNP-M23 TaxID=3072793 RepID=UPI00281639C0|nr:GntR family transcriptional regulator [Acuticoccus sp. MNP-M23]WMS43429.1 GntR family transcriptional regulator [Acuticoccus sp. MNP-M23]